MRLNINFSKKFSHLVHLIQSKMIMVKLFTRYDFTLIHKLLSNTYIQIGFKQLGLGKHLQLTDLSGQNEYYASTDMIKMIKLLSFHFS